MLKNREIKLFFGGYFVLSALTAGFCFYFSAPAGWACLALALILGEGFWLVTWWRYQQIRRLSSYLASVYSGGEALDIRDNREGELSILKNDIYKITRVLTRQAELLHQDKDYLAEALGNISHQLKTPLTSLYVMTDLLKAPGLPQEKRQEFLTRTTDQLDRIQWLVASLLKLSRIDAAVVTFKKEPVMITELLNRAVAPFEIPMEAKEIQLTKTGDAALCWTGDMSWTAEAVGNIIKNCVEHTPQGGSIWVDCVENPLHTEISITDNGPGIPPRDLPFLFQRFYKGENAGADSVGIGLAMAKTILQSQNADVFAENLPQGGAKFTIKLYKQVV